MAIKDSGKQKSSAAPPLGKSVDLAEKDVTKEKSSTMLPAGKYLDNDIAPELTKSILEAEKTLKEKTSPEESKFNKVNVNETFDLSNLDESGGFDLRKIKESESSDAVYPNITLHSSTIRNELSEIKKVANEVKKLRMDEKDDKKSVENNSTREDNKVIGEKDTLTNDVSGSLVKEEGPLGFIRNTSSDITESVDLPVDNGKGDDSSSKNSSIITVPATSPSSVNGDNQTNLSEKPGTVLPLDSSQSSENVTTKNESGSDGVSGIATLMQDVEKEEEPGTNTDAKQLETIFTNQNTTSKDDTTVKHTNGRNVSSSASGDERFAEYFTTSRNADVENIKHAIGDTLKNLSHVSPQLALFSSKLDKTFKKVFQVSDEPELLSPRFGSILAKLKNISALLQQETPSKRSREHEKDIRLLQEVLRDLKSFVVV